VPRILVVDDDPMVCVAIEVYLSARVLTSPLPTGLMQACARSNRPPST
jgi:hypothetical protein